MRTLGTGYFFELRDGTLEVYLYGKLFPTLDKEKLWNNYLSYYSGALDGDRDWASGAGEKLVIWRQTDKSPIFVHLLQEGKHENLAKDYDKRYESLEEPENHNPFWLWPLEEYAVIQMPSDFFRQRNKNIDAEPQKLYKKVLTVEDVAKHPTFARCVQSRIEEISRWALDSRTQIKSGRERIIRDNEEVINRILTVLKGR